MSSRSWSRSSRPISTAESFQEEKHMSTLHIPGFSAEASLDGGSGQHYRTGAAMAGSGANEILMQMSVRPKPAGDSENLLVCLGACLCCGLCDEGPWRRASCSLCHRCVGSPDPGPVIVAWEPCPAKWSIHFTARQFDRSRAIERVPILPEAVSLRSGLSWRARQRRQRIVRQSNNPDLIRD